MQEYFKSMEQQATLSNFWNYYTSVIDSTHHLFPRRNYAVLALDECNTFRTLSSFLCPIRLGGKYTRHDIANYVARIPFYSSWTAFSDTTHRQLSKLTSAIANKLHHSTQPLSDSFLHPVVCAESRFTQVATPGSLVSRGFGSVLDHAILLCSLFLGAGHDAYLAIGTTYGKHTVWVITIDRRKHSHPVFSADIVEDTPTNNHSNAFRGGSSPFDPHAFLQRSKLEAVQRANAQLVVQHWDPMQGKSWTSWNEHNFPYERVACLVNHTNVWFNVQPSDCLTREMFSWEVEGGGAGAWLPFVAGGSGGNGEFREVMHCFYATPTVLHDVTLTFSPDDTNLLRQVMQLIRSYRKNHLLMTTQFHRGLSKWQQQVIPELETMDMEQQRASRTRGPTGTQSAHLGCGAKTGGGELGGSTTIVKEGQCLLDPGANVPSQTVYVHRFLQFHGRVSAIAILHHLVSLGLVDCSVPGCAFSIALGSMVYPLGAHRVWLGIGELTPIG
ncbi:hypothetical protein BCR44DRAFT_37706 [Catenaria anguillulae PL171]|uniref:CEP76/DRC7 peptidase-like domain-containing protein n=1 Tax=Catenaria anguillulae PL171 TaxID=765915 RepID=A0A1Y2HNU3_9FUNG|nr:hypothetical protein BCR44DRAFT_37706 [Catenaria anguillulae PL171]